MLSPWLAIEVLSSVVATCWTEFTKERRGDEATLKFRGELWGREGSAPSSTSDRYTTCYTTCYTTGLRRGRRSLAPWPYLAFQKMVDIPLSSTISPLILVRLPSLGTRTQASRIRLSGLVRS
jgi:hypothetical protein